MVKKHYLKSKTLWANILIIVAGVCTAVSSDLIAGNVISVLGLVNIVLRVLTKNGIKY